MRSDSDRDCPATVYGRPDDDAGHLAAAHLHLVYNSNACAISLCSFLRFIEGGERPSSFRPISIPAAVGEKDQNSTATLVLLFFSSVMTIAQATRFSLRDPLRRMP